MDTSAWAKWYFPEKGSDAFEAWFRDAVDAWTSDLASLEFRSIIARRRRMGELPAEFAAETKTALAHDIRDGSLAIRNMESSHFVEAERILDECPDVALRSLDALHLAMARLGGAMELATADRVLADAAVEIGLQVRFFGPRRKPGIRK